MAGSAGQDDEALWDQAMAWHDKVLAAPDDIRIATALDAWRRADARHDAVYAQVERIWGLSGGLEPAFPDPEAAARQLAAPSHFDRVAPIRPPPRRHLIGWSAAALAAALLVVLAGPSLLVRLQADHRTAVGERQRIVLDEGSTVVLNTDSAIAVNFTATTRDITLLKGEAFFTVAHDGGARPFVVHGDGLRILDIGTAFDVALKPAEMSVSVENGIVEARWAAGTPRRLGVGDRLRIDRQSGLVRADRIDAGQVAAWRNGQLIVEDATVADVVAELRRHYQGFIVIRNDSLARRRLTGIYDLKDPVAALQAVVGPYAGTIRQITPFVLIIS